MSVSLCCLSCFFFSSRRRHTRCSRDWSSDVCSSDLSLRRSRGAPVCFLRRLSLSELLVVGLICSCAQAAESTVIAHFRNDVQPLLAKYCYDCHGDGMNKGGIAFDELKTDKAVLYHDLWLKALKNTRAGLMPPAKKPQPSAEERQRLEKWIKYEAFGIDARNPDPGRVTARRLNRIEYRNTIRDLLGIDFNSEVEFPPDDTGYGFDDIGDVLTVSPILLEKYMVAAKTIVSEAVPTVSKIIPERTISGARFRNIPPGKENAERHRHKDGYLSLSYYDPAVVSNAFHIGD